MRALAIVVVLVVAGLSASVACAQMSSSIPPGAVASNVRVVGYSEVDGRPPFKLSILARNGRWYLYAGHLWHRGWSVLDVTDPSKPSVANFVPGPANTWTIQMEIGDGKMITALEKIAPGWGGDPVQPNDEGVLIVTASAKEAFARSTVMVPASKPFGYPASARSCRALLGSSG